MSIRKAAINAINLLKRYLLIELILFVFIELICLFVFLIYCRTNWMCLGMVVWLPRQGSPSQGMGLSQPLQSLKINWDQVARMMAS